MEKRPWPLLILASLHLSEPLIKVLSYMIYWNCTLSYLLNLHSLQNPLIAFIFFFACPIAGGAIFAVRKWSLPVFILMQALIVYSHYRNHLEAPYLFSNFLFYGLCLGNLALVSYFLVPAVRLAYVDPKFRWWESKPRYEVKWQAKLTQDTHTQKGTIVNISESGVLLDESDRTLDTEKDIQVAFHYEGEDINLSGKAVRHFPNGSVYQYGVKFDKMPPSKRKKIKKCIQSLERLGVERRPRRGSSQTLLQWASTLLKTGQGLFPNYKTPKKS